jgi:hypothetical protein
MGGLTDATVQYSTIEGKRYSSEAHALSSSPLTFMEPPISSQTSTMTLSTPSQVSVRSFFFGCPQHENPSVKEGKTRCHSP